jgi:ATP-dependent RNA helicase DeaD
MQQIIRFTKGKVRRERVPTADEVEQKRTSAFVESLRETLEKGEYKRQDAVIDQLLNAGHSATDIASALMHLLGGDKPATQPIAEEQPRRQDFERRESGYERRDYPAYEPRAAKLGPPREPREPRGNRPPREIAATSHEVGMTRLVFNFGKLHGIGPGDIVGVICGGARLPKEEIGAITLLDKQTLVDVADGSSALVLKKLNGIKFKGRKLAVDLAG